MTTTSSGAVMIFAHDSGQRYNWGFSREAVALDRDKWFQTAKSLNSFPIECIGAITIVDLKLICDSDCYVG